MPTIPAILPQRFDPLVPLDQLHRHPANANDGDLGLLCTQLDALGFAGAVMAQESTGILIDGETRLDAAEEKGLPGLPVLWVDCDDDTRDRLLASWNETGRRGSNNLPKLVALLQGLAVTPRGLEGAAFDGDDLDRYIAELRREPEPPPEPGPPAELTCPACGHTAEPAAFTP